LDSLIFEDSGGLVLFGVECYECESAAVRFVEGLKSDKGRIVLREGSFDVIFSRTFRNATHKSRIALLNRARSKHNEFAIINNESIGGARRSIETIDAGKLNESKAPRDALGAIRASDDADILHWTILRKCLTQALAGARKIDVSNQNGVLDLLAVGHPR
jgi:hypothetical protein